MHESFNQMHSYLQSLNVLTVVEQSLLRGVIGYKMTEVIREHQSTDLPLSMVEIDRLAKLRNALQAQSCRVSALSKLIEASIPKLVTGAGEMIEMVRLF